MAEQLVVAAVRGGGVPWTFLESFPSLALLEASCANNGFRRGRTNNNSDTRCTYYNCTTLGCSKVYRAVTILCEIALEDADIVNQFSIQHDVDAVHSHAAVDLPLRGTKSALRN